ncbi:MAG: uracil-DNA glycosylase family protein [Planctomycetia bacterium]
MAERGRSLVEVARTLAREVDALSFAPPVACTYNPLAYAFEAHRAYLERWGGGRPEALWLGMNPGPFGMAQSGVPFGDVGMARDFLGIEAPVGRPPREHPKRPVEGYACTRGEVSGRRLWGFVQERFGRPQAFFRRFFALNYCPLAFVEASGKNRTPDHLPAGERAPLFAACDRALVAAVEVLGVRAVLGVGAFAQQRARQALAGRPVEVHVLPHPSPASPAANRGWAALAERALATAGFPVPACAPPAAGARRAGGAGRGARRR